MRRKFSKLFKVKNIALVLFIFLISNLSYGLDNNQITNQINQNTYNIQPFIAKYKVFWKSISVGTSVHSLDKEKDIYTAKAISKPILAIFPFYSSEQSDFSYDESINQIIPISYKYYKKEKSKTSENELDFKTSSKLYSHKKLQDKLSHTFQLKEDLSNTPVLEIEKTNFVYSILKPDEQKEYEFIYKGSENLKTNLGKLNCVKLSHLNDSKKRETILWFAVDLNYTLVKIKQLRKGKELLSVNIVSYKENKIQ